MNSRGLALTLIVFLAVASFSASIGTVRGHSLPLVALTFDDGFVSGYNLVAPYLRTKGVTATFAVPVANVSGTFETVTCMTWDQIEELDDDGFEIASHGYGVTVDFTAATEEELLDNLNTSTYEEFDDNLGHVPDSFVIPWGAINSSGRLYASNYYANAWSISGVSGLYNSTAYVWNYGDEDVRDQVQWRSIRYRPATIYTNLNNSATVASAVAALIDEVVAYGEGYCLVLAFHDIRVSPRWSGVGAETYPDMDTGTFTTIIDDAVTHDVEFVTLSDIDGHFSGSGSIVSSSFGGVTAIYGPMVTLAVVGIVVGFLRKMGKI